MKKILILAGLLAAFLAPAQLVTVPLDVAHGTNGFVPLSTNAISGTIPLVRSTGYTVSGSFVPYAKNTNYNIGTGNLVFIASNSPDTVLWFRDAARDFSVYYTNSDTVNFYTNFTGLGQNPYEKYAAGNTGTNGSLIFSGTATVKTGF
jgi:hypothetical protein